ncbi:MAG: glutamate--tRNA ligase [Candidatus Diapherotrites archaeon]|nr:glutamate--tRNA ligase [Candidatus Diapherotrites archaeon]
MNEEANKFVRAAALKNAVDFGSADPKAIMGRVFGKFPKLRSNPGETAEQIAKVCVEVNSMPAGEAKAEFERDFQGMFPEKHEKRKDEKKGFSGISVKEGQKPVFRFAPNPNGPSTLGSSRGMVTNAVLAKEYGGKLIVRFDDTDPRTKRPMVEAYKWYLEDLEWLGFKADEVVIASGNIENYYEHAKKLIELNGAYVCKCGVEENRGFRSAGKPCPHRNQSVGENKALFEKMIEGGFEEGQAVLKVKTRVDHRNPALRDWIAFRIIREDHPLAGSKYVVWPLLDFESAIEDHVRGVTHIIRGKDLRDSTFKQQFVYDYFGWTYPSVKYWGRVAVHGFGKLSTSGISAGIKEGEFSGWDDPRLPTLCALRRRGFQPQAIIEFWTQIGLSEKDISASLETLEAVNKGFIEKDADRFFFAADPVKLVVKNTPKCELSLKVHPDFPERGKRTYSLEQGNAEFFVSKTDADLFEAGQVIRLKDAFNFRVVSVSTQDGFEVEAEFVDFELQPKTKKIQWVLQGRSMPCEILLPDSTLLLGKTEAEAKNIRQGQIIQLERLFFARVEQPGEKLKLICTHK